MADRERIVLVRVEAGRDEQQLRARSVRAPGSTSSSSACRYCSSPEPGRSGMFSGRLALLVGAAGARIERPLVERDEEHVSGRPRRSPACRCRGGRPSRRSRRARAPSSACAQRAAIATLSKRQKPIARCGSAWWPGGRTSANASCVDRLRSSSRPRAAPPRTTSRWQTVSPSSQVSRSIGCDPLDVRRACGSAARRPRRAAPGSASTRSARAARAAARATPDGDASDGGGREPRG